MRTPARIKRWDQIVEVEESNVRISLIIYAFYYTSLFLYSSIILFALFWLCVCVCCAQTNKRHFAYLIYCRLDCL